MRLLPSISTPELEVAVLADPSMPIHGRDALCRSGTVVERPSNKQCDPASRLYDRVSVRIFASACLAVLDRASEALLGETAAGAAGEI